MLAASALLSSPARVFSQAPPSTQVANNTGPDDGVLHKRGQLVAPIYEGWYRDDSGTLNLSFGYLNRNLEEELDIPAGPNNKIEPGPIDQGQPTHFVPRRQWGAFSVVVPKDVERTLLAEKKTITWTIRANDQTASVPANLGPAYTINALKEPTVGNTPPALRFGESSPSGSGPFGAKTAIKAIAGTPTVITLWVDDDKRALPQRTNPGVTLNWTRYRGKGALTFANATPKVVGTGTAIVTATFAEPGEYVLRVEAIDTDNHDFQCCWSNGYVHASVSSNTSR